MKVNEIFLSISGEGKEIGLPTVFIRFTGCNIRCEYCDTKYAYTEGTEMTVQEILDKVYALLEPGYQVLLTGGEPLMQPHAELRKILKDLHWDGYYTIIETNGAVSLEGIDELRSETDSIVESIVLDYKLPSSGMTSKMVIGNWSYLRERDQLKFVVGSDEDFDVACNVIKNWPFTWKPHFLFSPVFGKMDPQKLVKRLLSSKINARMQMQLHKQIWDPAKRGV